MKLTINNSSQSTGTRLSTTCPYCGHNGTFDTVNVNDMVDDQNNIFGQRRCPNLSCFGHVFFVRTRDGVFFTYPPRKIDFEKSNIPDNVLVAFEEAIVCQANKCFIATAIMVRKTLEEICHNQGATGANLKEKIKSLGAKIIIPKGLIDGLDDLRLLGNDAAHIESQTFNQVGHEETEISIQFTKEILKAVYQYEDLVKKLKSLKKTTP